MRPHTMTRTWIFNLHTRLKMTNLNNNAMTALSNTHAAQSIMEKSFHDGALDYLPNESTYDALDASILYWSRRRLRWRLS